MKCSVAFAVLGLFLGCTLQAVKSEEQMQDEEEAYINVLREMTSPDGDFEDQNDDLDDNDVDKDNDDVNDDDDDDDDDNYEEDYRIDDELENPREMQNDEREDPVPKPFWRWRRIKRRFRRIIRRVRGFRVRFPIPARPGPR